MVLYLILFVMLAFVVLKSNRPGICNSQKRLTGKTALVTGGTNGIGLEIAKNFAKRGAKVIIACPFEEEGINANKVIIKETGNDKVYFRLLDLGSFQSVREFSTNIIKTEERLDILVNNAGIGAPKDFVTRDGLNVIMQVNYYGHFLLTLLLLPLIRKTGTPSEPARILNNGSFFVHLKITNLDYITLDIGGSSAIKKQIIYGTSKSCLSIFTRELTKKVSPNIVVNTADPGAVGTTLFFSSGFIIGQFIKILFYYFGNTPLEGAQTAIHIVVETNAKEVRGQYFRNRKICKQPSTASDDELTSRVWKESVRIVKLTDTELKECLISF